MNDSIVVSEKEPLDAGLTVSELDSAHQFEFTAEFTGQLGSLGAYRFKPLVPVEKGHRYRASINRETGATLFTPLGPDPDAPAKTVSAKLWDQVKRRMDSGAHR